MAVYAIGDVQGCYDELCQLLDHLHFNPAEDRLWFAGDLVNRGPRSLEVLRFVKGLGEGAVTVLGNHDLHLLAVGMNKHRHFKSNDTLVPILEAPDREELLEWLRQRPLLHHEGGLTLVHAGLPPQWDVEKAAACAREVEEVLRGDEFAAFIDQMYGNDPHLWSEGLAGWERWRFTVNCLTRLRFCTPDGRLDLKHKLAPGTQEGGYLPWFKVEWRRSAGEKILFGHWSTLGFHDADNVICLDTGCLWGGALTAVRVDDGSFAPRFVACAGSARPGED